MTAKLYRVTPDLAVRKTAGTFSATFTTSSGLVELDMGDGTVQTTNSPSKTYIALPPYLLNILSLKSVITGFTCTGQGLTSVAIPEMTALLNLDVSNNSIGSDDLDDILEELDEYGLTGGTLDVSSNNFTKGLSADASTAKDNLIAKGWTLTGLPVNWTPAEITTSAWFDGDDAGTITSSGGLVSQWDDKSGNANHLTQGTGSDQPATGTRTINGQNVVDFDGSNDFMSWSTAFGLVGKQAYMVGELDSYGGNVLSIVSGDNTQANLGANASTGMRLWKSGANPYSGDTKSSTIITLGEAGVYGWLADTDNKKFDINGNIQVTDGYVGGNTFPIDKVGEGQFSSNCEFALAELVITSSTLSESDRQKVEGYLAHKWGTEDKLPASHPYKTSAPIV